MRDKLLLGLLVIAVLLVSTFFVAALAYNDSLGDSGDSSEKATIRLLDLDEDDDDESGEDEEEDAPITGSALERASRIALDYIGEGEVTDTEIGDEEGYYEIEITLDNGKEMDVHLDENFNVLSVEYD